MDNNQNQQPNGYGMPQPNMQAGMPGQTPQPGYGTPGQTPQQGYGMPGQGVQPGMQAGMPGQTHSLAMECRDKTCSRDTACHSSQPVGISRQRKRKPD